MVILIALFLVFYGFFVVFYSSILDLASTYLPEKLIFSMFPVGYLGWGLFSLFTGDASFALRSVVASAVAFLFGYILFRLRQWASGDMWLLAGIFAVLSPAFPNFNFAYPLLLVPAVGVWSLLSYLFVLSVNGEWPSVAVLIFMSALASALAPAGYLMLVLVLIFTGFFLLTFQKVKRILQGEKEICRLEEDDWVFDDVDLGFAQIRRTMPITKYESFLAAVSGIRRKAKVKLGVPLTPAFSLALAGLLAGII